MELPIGTFINIAAVLIGGTIGLILKEAFPKKIKEIIFQTTGLFTLFLGVYMAFEVSDILVMIFSLLIGSILGEAVNVDKGLKTLGDWLKKKLGSKESKFSEGLVTTFILYCIGSLTIVGSINEGISGDRSLLVTKSILDGFSSIAFAAVYGIGVLFVVIPMLVFQGGLTLLASFAEPLFTEVMISQLTAVGGVMIMGIGMNLLEIKSIRVANMLPSLIVSIILTVLFL